MSKAVLSDIKYVFRYERQLEGPFEGRRKSHEPPQLTRSKTLPYNKNACFFCEKQESAKQPLHIVSTLSAGESLNNAIKLSGNDVLRVKLSTAVNSDDAHAIDLKYHKNCWLKNVTNVLRKASSSDECRSSLFNEAAARVEFLVLTETALRQGQIVTMSELQSTFENVSRANDAFNTAQSRKTIKLLLQSEIPDIEFHKPRKVNEPERASIKKTRDEAIQLSENMKVDCNEEMKVLFDAAVTLRKVINRSKRWEFTGSFEDVINNNIVPEQLYLFYRWLIQGPKTAETCEEKQEDVKKRAISLAQSTVSMCLTERQTSNKKSQNHCASLEKCHSSWLLD